MVTIPTGFAESCDEDIGWSGNNSKPCRLQGLRVEIAKANLNYEMSWETVGDAFRRSFAQLDRLIFPDSFVESLFTFDLHI